MKTLLLLLCVLLTGCSPKTYTEPEYGMPAADFHNLCGYSSYDTTDTTVTIDGNIHVINMRDEGERVVKLDKNASNRTNKGCVGKFTFVKGELADISR